MNEIALRERIKVAAKERKIAFNECWRYLLLERFLVRLAHSEHQNKFIFKGGLLLAQYLTIGRQTVDVDFLLRKHKSDALAIEVAVKQILKAEIVDGFHFHWDGIEQLTHPEKEYAGLRISLRVQLGKMRDKIRLDIGVGDPVEPIEENLRRMEYKGKPIFPEEIALLVYPAESIFSEKLEAVVSIDSRNSRMKDYHDLFLMMQEPKLLNKNKLSDAIRATFSHRHTKLALPIQFDAEGMKSLQASWENHLKNLSDAAVRELRLPKKIGTVLKKINEWISGFSL